MDPNQNPQHQHQQQHDQAAQGDANQWQQLMRRFRNKKDLHRYLGDQLQMFLPRLKACSLIFMQQILTN